MAHEDAQAAQKGAMACPASGYGTIRFGDGTTIAGWIQSFRYRDGGHGVAAHFAKEGRYCLDYIMRVENVSWIIWDTATLRRPGDDQPPMTVDELAEDRLMGRAASCTTLTPPCIGR